MPGSSDQFADETERVLVPAPEEARHDALSHAGTGHLLALVQGHDGMAARVLARAGATPDGPRTAVDGLLGVLTDGGMATQASRSLGVDPGAVRAAAARASSPDDG